MAGSERARQKGKGRGVRGGMIRVRGARQNNLKGIDVDLPLGELIVVTGPSGSGKSSFAFQTLYAEGQRRYVETFSPYVRQFFERMDKPEVDDIEGIPPAIALSQGNQVKTTRSTVGTVTEINDYLKLLFPRLAVAHDPVDGSEIRPDTAESIYGRAVRRFGGRGVLVTFPVAAPPDADAGAFLEFLGGQGYLRVLMGGRVWRTDEGAGGGRLPAPAWRSGHLVVQDRVRASGEARARGRILEAIEVGLRLGKGEVVLVPDDALDDPGSWLAASTDWSNPSTGTRLRAPVPALFSFNSPVGACAACKGFGRVIGIDLELAVPDKRLSLREGAVRAFQGERGSECQADLERCARERLIDLDLPFQDLDPAEQDWVLYGERGDPETLWETGEWYGVKGFFDWLESKSYKMHVRVFLSRYRAYTRCLECRGRRLREEALAFRLAGKTLPELWDMPVAELGRWVAGELPGGADPTTTLVLGEIRSRLRYLDEVGLGYLTLGRPSRSLSGGEMQRVNLTTCLGAALVNTLFVLDEPSVGLHPRDIDRLLGILRGLRDKGNSLVVVEHEEAVMRAADRIVEIGPGRGEGGGQLVYAGPLAGLADGSVAGSLTGGYLSGALTIPVPGRRREGRGELVVRGAREHNLKGIDVAFPLGVLVAVTGVSGSGKSTLVHRVLYEQLAKRLGIPAEGEAGACDGIEGWEQIGELVLVDQAPLGRTPRSTPAVYLGVFDGIRRLFGDTDEAREQGLGAGFFSFNSGEGRCRRCGGKGYERIEMQFLSDLDLACPECGGKRYGDAALEIRLGGKNIAEVLDLTVAEAIGYLAELRPGLGTAGKRVAGAMGAVLERAGEVGLDYLRLGQPLTTLSGGESQRLKLLSHLLRKGGNKNEGGRALLIFDEPTTGLHLDDIRLLLGAIGRLVEAGDSVIVIEHNLEVIKAADHVIDLGPEGGEGGGRLVVQGTPERVAAEAGSWTGRHLSGVLPQKGNKGAQITCSQTDKNVSDVSAKIEKREKDGYIVVSGAREHNLKDIDVSVPRDRFVVVSGLSGSGKSTLAFDIIFAEGQRRFLDAMSPYARQFAEQLEKPDVDLVTGVPPTVAIEQRVSQGGRKSTVGTVTEVHHFLRLLFAKVGVPHCPDSDVPLEAQSESAIVGKVRALAKRGPVRVLAPVVRGRKGFHSDVIERAAKKGYGEVLIDGTLRASGGRVRLDRYREHDVDIVVGVLGGKEGVLEVGKVVGKALEMGGGVLRTLGEEGGIDVFSVRLTSPATGLSYSAPEPASFSFHSPRGWCEECRGYGEVPRRVRVQRGLETVLEEELDYEGRMERAEASELVPCGSCGGARIGRFARAVRVGGQRLEDIVGLGVAEARELVGSLRFRGRERELARDIVPEITQRLAFLENVGLGYLSLDRSARTLSGGESQRIRLASQLGSNLSGVLYVLDEPTIGLHPRDNVRLLDTLVALRDRGNSLLVVEHDDDTILRADELIDLGPGAGREGGEVLYQGKPRRGARGAGKSRTLRALGGGGGHPWRGGRRAVPGAGARTGWLRVKDCRANNLRGVDLRVPIGRLTVLCGVSGAGKSSLMRRCLKEAAEAATGMGGRGRRAAAAGAASGFDVVQAVYEVDQSPIGKTSRSCPATYTKVFDQIRALFAAAPEARARGFDASRFSFNTEGGRCESCGGNGRIKLEMNFLPSTWVPCDDCGGLRFNEATLEVKWGGKNIGEVLELTVAEAAVFFAAQPKLARVMRLLEESGLGYLALGQPSPTLSGGEAQRLKLVTQLARGVGRAERAAMKGVRRGEGSLFLIEEPSIGLHVEDVRRLIDVLHRLVDDGHTVVVIEHDLDVMAEADYLIEVGPEAGEGGGRIVAQGSPEDIARAEGSVTGPFLRGRLGEGA